MMTFFKPCPCNLWQNRQIFTSKNKSFSINDELFIPINPINLTEEFIKKLEKNKQFIQKYTVETELADGLLIASGYAKSIDELWEHSKNNVNKSEILMEIILFEALENDASLPTEIKFKSLLFRLQVIVILSSLKDWGPKEIEYIQRNEEEIYLKSIYYKFMRDISIKPHEYTKAHTAQIEEAFHRDISFYFKQEESKISHSDENKNNDSTCISQEIKERYVDNASLESYGTSANLKKRIAFTQAGQVNTVLDEEILVPAFSSLCPINPFHCTLSPKNSEEVPNNAPCCVTELIQNKDEKDEEQSMPRVLEASVINPEKTAEKTLHEKQNLYIEGQTKTKTSKSIIQIIKMILKQ